MFNVKINRNTMAKGIKLSELAKFQKAVNEIDFTQIKKEEVDAIIKNAYKNAKKVSIQKQIEKLQKQLEKMNQVGQFSHLFFIPP